MSLYDLNKILTVARGNGFIFNQTNNFKMEIYSNISIINIHFYLKHRIPIVHRHFFGKFSQNLNYIQTPCNDRRNLSHFDCRRWYLYNNSQC